MEWGAVKKDKLSRIIATGHEKAAADHGLPEAMRVLSWLGLGGFGGRFSVMAELTVVSVQWLLEGLVGTPVGATHWSV